MKIKALGKHIILTQFPDEVSTDSGIVLSKDIKTYRYGKILSVGSEVQYYAAGDTVIYPADATVTFTLGEGDEEETYYLIKDEDFIYVRVS